MRMKFFVLTLLMMVVVVGCDDVLPGANARPTDPPQLRSAEEVARAFLDAWIAEDYDTMYAQISPLAQRTSRATFTDVYTRVAGELTLQPENGKSVTLHTVTTQGDTTIIKYDVTFRSTALGEFTDAGRTMRLVRTRADGWRIAWSTMDIFHGMAGGATLTREEALSPRGTIFDRNGNPIAMDGITSYPIALMPGQYRGNGEDACYAEIAATFRLRQTDIERRFGDYPAADFRQDGFTLGVVPPPDLESTLNRLNQHCYVFERDPATTRFYYGGGAGAQIIGYVGPIQEGQQAEYPGFPPSALVGQIGLERTLQQQLAGTPGASLVIRSPEGTLIRELQAQTATRGQDVTLTLDRDLQLACDQALADAFNAAQNNWARADIASGAAAVVLDVKTGEVMAMCSFPGITPDVFQIGTTTFDGFWLDDYNRNRATRNRATDEIYSPGSVFKIISMAAAAQEGAFGLDETINCTGWYDANDILGMRLQDWINWDPRDGEDNHGVLDLKEGLAGSCDIYFWSIGRELDAVSSDIWRRYSNQMGLGVATGIPFMSEAAGQIPNPQLVQRLHSRGWGTADSLNASIGQGDTQVTVLQVARMMMGVANGGDMYKPIIVRQYGYPEQEPAFVQNPEIAGDNGLSDEVIAGVQEALCMVTYDNNKFGTAQWVFEGFPLNEIRVCGKTGTAQASEYPNGWFTAFAGPRTGQPEIAVAVMVERSREGSETAAPIVRRIIESYYGVPLSPFPEFWAEPYVPLPIPGEGHSGGA